MDEDLMANTMKFIELNMVTIGYSLDAFVSDMKTGRTILHQKLLDIVGMFIKDFILNIRLKCNAYLLQLSDLTGLSLLMKLASTMQSILRLL